jgi:hypothetical protein
MSRKSDKIKNAIESLGETNVRVWYEPLHGPDMEMCGYAGGWFWENDDHTRDSLGYNLSEALKMVELESELRNIGRP